MKRILVTTAGGGVGNNLIRGLLRSRKYALEIIGTNIDKFYLARSLAHKNYLVPRADAGDAYIEAIRRIVDDEHIDLIIVGNDAEVGPVSKYRDRFGAKVLLPSPETIERCQDKLTLNAHLAGQGIPVAETHPVTTIDEMDSVFQHFAGDDLVWCRMRQGSASKGSLPVKTLEQARAWVSYWRDMRRVPPERFLLCEYLPGRDYAFQSLWYNGTLVIAKTC